MAWSKVQVNGMPGERECHGWTVAGTKAWLSFGNNRERRYKDLHAWDEESLTWNEVPVSKSRDAALAWPSSRSAASQCLWVRVCAAGEAVTCNHAGLARHISSALRAQRDRFLVVFGGWDGGGEQNDTWVFDTEELHWSKLETNGEQCDARHFHVAEIVKDTMVVFSGYDGQAWRSDLWTLDLLSGTWTHHRRSVGGQEPWPSARASAASIIVQGSTLMLLGGYNGQAFLNDLWFLDVAALTSTVAPQVEWVQHTPPPRVVGGAASPSAAGGESAASFQEQASWPLPRSGHCMGALGPYVIVVGGRHAEGRYNDVCVLDLDSMVWRKVEVQGQPPSGRKTHSAVILGSVMYVFGGHNGDRWLGDMHRLALQPILQQLRVPLSIGARTETLAGALLRRCTTPHLGSDAPECLSNARGGVSSLALPGVLAQLPHATTGQSNTSTAAAVQRLQKELGLLAQYNLDTCPSTLAHVSERLEASLATFRGTEMRAGDLHFLDPGYWARPDTAAAASAFSSSQEALGNAGVHHSGAAELGSLGSPVQCQLSARADSRSTADTILLVCGQRFPVHAAVISARCTYFDVLLKSPMCRAAVGQGNSQPREVEVHGVEDVFAFAAMLFFLYTDLLPLGLGDDNVQALFHVSNKFQVPTLLRHCERFLEARITVDNAASMLEMADTVGASSLAAACTAFSTEPWRFPEVAASSGFLALSSDLQVRIVQGHARKRNPTCVLPLVSEKVSLPVVVPGGASVTSRPAQ